MQALDDLSQQSGQHRHLIAPGRSAGTREKPDCHLVVNPHRARVRRFARNLIIGEQTSPEHKQAHR